MSDSVRKAALRHAASTSRLPAIHACRRATVAIEHDGGERLGGRVRLGVGAVSSQLWRAEPIRHGRDRPGRGSPSSTNPCLARWRRWNEQLAGVSPSRSPASVAVSSPSRATSSIRSIRVGCAIARMTRASVSLRASKDMFRNISFDSRRVKCEPSPPPPAYARAGRHIVVTIWPPASSIRPWGSNPWRM